MDKSSKEIKLERWEEAVGTLRKIEKKEGLIRISLRCVKETIAILADNSSTPKDLQSLVGKKIGILRTDSLERPFRIRRVRKRKGT
jgi:hypothetical protein